MVRVGKEEVRQQVLLLACCKVHMSWPEPALGRTDSEDSI